MKLLNQHIPILRKLEHRGPQGQCLSFTKVDHRSWSKSYIRNCWCHWKLNRESTEGYPRGNVAKRHGKAGTTGLNNWSTSKSPKGDEPGVRKGMHSLLACRTRCKINAPWKPLVFGEGQARYQGHEIDGKSDRFGNH